MNFEQPLPVLDVSEEAIAFETKDTTQGELTVKNLGGGTLKGYIASRHAALVFAPDWWEGNTEKLRYTFYPAKSDTAPGETFTTRVYICSNGGEAILEVTIRLTKMAIYTREGITIANVRDFYDYARAHPTAARQVFTDSEFYMLLLTIGYPYMEVYESLHKDANRERAMDNFFILSGLKEKTTISIVQRAYMFDAPSSKPDKLTGHIVVEKSDDGFYEAPIVKESNAPWLTLSANRLIPADFDSERRAKVAFTLDPKKIPAAYARERVLIEEQPAEITFRRPPLFAARLNRDSYRFDDKGTLEIMNNTGADLTVEVFCADSYIRFEAKRFPVGKIYEIPFTVKLSAFMNAGRIFRKTPYMRTTIELKGIRPGHVYSLRVPISVGEW